VQDGITGRKNRTDIERNKIKPSERRALSGLYFAGFEVHSTSEDEFNEQGNTGDIWGALGSITNGSQSCCQANRARTMLV